MFELAYHELSSLQKKESHDDTERKGLVSDEENSDLSHPPATRQPSQSLEMATTLVNLGLALARLRRYQDALTCLDGAVKTATERCV
mgnify:CR=1 FL=1